MSAHYATVKYRCRSGFEWDLIATVDQQVHPALRADPPRGVAGSGGLPEGACQPPSSTYLTERATAELHSNRHPDHIRRGSILIEE